MLRTTYLLNEAQDIWNDTNHSIWIPDFHDYNFE